MKSYIVKCDDVRETDVAIGLPVGENGHRPVKYHVWISLQDCKIQDKGLYYIVSIKDEALKKLTDTDAVVTHIPL